MAHWIVTGTINYLKPKLPRFYGFALRHALPRPPIIYKNSSRFIIKRAIVRAQLSRRGRDFVGLPVGRAIRARLVIQLHHAKRAGDHYDLRLKIGDKVYSWAGRKLPIDGRKVGYTVQPLHPEESLDLDGFEIADGNYGAGWYEQLFDEDIWISESDEGGLVFWNDGDNILPRGRFVLHETNDGRWIWYQTSRDLDPLAGTERHKFKLASKDKIDPSLIATKKIDGSHELVELRGKWARFFSHRYSKRDGNRIEHTHKLAHLRELDGDIKQTIVHGEIYHPKGASFLGGLLNSREIRPEAEDIKLALFDVAKYNGRDVRNLPYGERYEILKEIAELNKGFEVVERAADGETPLEFYERVLKDDSQPHDGIVLSPRDAKYQEAPLLKLKPADSVDCPVVGFTEGQGRLKGSLGALICDVDGKKVHVGSGFTDEQRKWIWEHKDDIESEVAEVLFHQRTNQEYTGPRFVRFHPSKSEVALKMYADGASSEPKSLLYALKSAAGWRR